MANNETVLVLCLNTEPVESIRDSLRGADIEVVSTTTAGEAIKQLKGGRIGLLIVDAALHNPPAADFLEKARKFLPSVPRALFESSKIEDLDLREVINRAEPCAIFTEFVDSGRVSRLIERRKQAPKAQAPAPRSAAPAQPVVLNLRPLAQPEVKSVKVESVFGGPAKKSEPEKAEKEQEAKKDFVEPTHFSTNATGEPLIKTPVEPPQYEDTKIEIDLMSDDIPGEVARVLDLMLEEPDIQLPVLPQIASEIRKAVSKENVSFEEIAEIVSLDPSMSARLLEVANSPLYSGKEPTRNLQQAVSRIGLREVRNMLLALASENLFDVKDKRLALLMTKLWMHNLSCAYSNEIMAKDLYIEESSDFFMMGLLHDIGKLMILHLIQEGYNRKIWSKKTISDELLDEILTTRHNIFGARLMQKWGYDESFQQVVYLHNDDFFVHEYDEAVVVTFFSNLLTRKLGFSLMSYDKERDPLEHHEIAQALNMSPTVRSRVEETMRVTVQKIKESYF